MKIDDNSKPFFAQPLLFPGLGWALLGVIGFSGTVPALRIASPVLGPWFVGLGRALIAAAIAAVILAVRRDRPPSPAQTARLLGMGVVFSIVFPAAVALAVQTVPAAHAAVIIGLAPASTAVFAALRTQTRPRRTQTVGVALGAASVIAFAVAQAGTLHLGRGDLLLLGAVAIVGAGYAEGGLLARADELGSGWRVTCWTLVVSAPAVAATWWWVSPPLRVGTLAAWLGLAYMSGISMLLASFAWYRGLAAGDLGRTSQVQLLQPVLSIAWAVLLLGEPMSLATGLGAVGVVAAVALTQRG